MELQNSKCNGDFLSQDFKTEVVIIGAGAAGIAAASKLIESGIAFVTVIEAENRIGGRIHSVFLGDAFVDLGAEEVHGENENVIVELAGDYLRKKTPLTQSTCYYSNGQKIEKHLQNEVMKFIEKFCENTIETKETIGEVFIRRYKSAVLNRYSDDPEKTKILTDFLPLCESFYAILDGPYSWFDAVIESSSHYVDCEGDQFIGWNGHGCKIILDMIMQNVQTTIKDRILKNKRVENIFWDTTEKVQVACSDSQIYTADHVIFTPSVGVLKNKHRDIFQPSLPKNKVESAEKIGFANVMKVAIKFSTKWWSKAPYGFVWNEQDRENIQLDNKKFALPTGRSWLTAIHWLIEAPDNDQVLVAWLTGSATIHVEKLENDTIKEGLMYVIRKFLSKSHEIPEPSLIIPTRWKSNPNFYGAYSYETVEASSLEVPHQKVLEEPLKNSVGTPVVLFAGEATHLTQFSTVNGAILSGYREANRIIDMYKDE